MSFSRRKTLFVNAQIQGSLLRRFFAFWVLYHALLWLFMFVVYAVREQPAATVAESFQAFVQTQTLLPIAALAMLPIAVWKVLCLSHRIAGPLHQLRNRLRDMAAGGPPEEVRFRHDDLLREIQLAFNNYVAFVREQRPTESPGRDRTQHIDDDRRVLDAAEDLTRLTRDDSATQPQGSPADV